MYERLIPDPREELMGNEWDVLDEHPSTHHGGHTAGAGFGAGAPVEDDIERAI